MSVKESLPPNYARLDVALRSIGYSFEAALADIIDNSIDASARSVLVRLVTRRNRPLDIAIWDDGVGMSPPLLKEAMKFGADVNQEIGRLGKFGLGLKLASLSQARELRVFSYRDGQTSGRGWLEEGIKNAFTCEIFDPKECQTAIKDLVPDRRWKKSGTLVWWSQLYRVGQNHSSPNEHAQKLLHRLNNYLSLAFHRFLDGSPRKVDIQLEIYDADTKTSGVPWPLTALNPFGYDRSGHKGFPHRMFLQDGYKDRVSVTAHIWPPNSDAPNYKLPGGANARQGFYFYRNNRLIQGGGWNGIREAEPHSSLARVEIDIAPDVDVELSLDVKKVEIQLPSSLATAFQKAKTESGIDFKKYLSLADETYRTRQATDAELPLIPSQGLPAQFAEFLHRELRIKSTSKHKDLAIEWADLSRDAFFDFDRKEGRLYLNRAYRKMLLHGLPGSSADLPVVKCLVFLLLRDALASQRTGSKVREQLDLLNRILIEAVKYERVKS
jgi:hypothetical protein